MQTAGMERHFEKRKIYMLSSLANRSPELLHMTYLPIWYCTIKLEYFDDNRQVINRLT